MRAEQKTVRQSVSLPASVATPVRAMAKTRRLSATRMLVEPIEKRKQQEFFELAERFREAKDPDSARRLGNAEDRSLGELSRGVRLHLGS